MKKEIYYQAEFNWSLDHRYEPKIQILDTLLEFLNDTDLTAESLDVKIKEPSWMVDTTRSIEIHGKSITKQERNAIKSIENIVNMIRESNESQHRSYLSAR